MVMALARPPVRFLVVLCWARIFLCKMHVSSCVGDGKHLLCGSLGRFGEYGAFGFPRPLPLLYVRK